MTTEDATFARKTNEVKRPRNPIQKAADDPKSKVKALRAYFWDMEKVLANQGTPEAGEQRRIADQRFRDARARSRKPGVGLPAVVKQLCVSCVGGHADRNPAILVGHCGCRDCPLHPVRPWRNMKWGKDLVSAAAKQAHEGAGEGI